MTRWPTETPGLVELPSGRLVRGRALSRPIPNGPEPTFGLYLLGRPPDPVPWPVRWIRWPDFRLPTDRDDARAALADAWGRAATDRVEVACGGGQGRTGTALACLAVLDGIPPDQAVAWVREHYRRRAVETPSQARFVRSFTPPV
jgi:hypothetical protein